MNALLIDSLLRHWKPLAAGVLAIAALVWFNHAAEQRGALAERQIWQARAARAAAAAIAQAQTRTAQREAALVAASERARRYADARKPIAQEVIRYVQSPAAATACPDAVGVHIGQASIDAANAAVAAAR
ncbi:hypothetical protein EUV02_01025 [Polymorphobacter arshaanensis]|uniref:Uncharacterized protein n=1 Tax=Glacieibacterium arshaanense TaxID=2511025 RepID=A0A4Y9EPV2_9SPHN|nr:hypothetical protein [Polymorphobacter arshaanensis]TFU05647.1 hypothetical protein EUV02_01025 [Polymorphobacter arshaanensis]